MNEQIARAIAATTGPGDSKPFVFRVVSLLVEWQGSYTGMFEDVQDYLIVNRIACIPALEYPKSAIRGV